MAGRLRRFLADPGGATPGGRPPLPVLTSRIREILDLLADGRTNSEIAQLLFLRSKTVKNNLSSVYAKLQVADRAQAVVRARQAGLGTP